MSAQTASRYDVVEVQTQREKGARWRVQALYMSEASAAEEVARWKERGINVRTVVKRAAIQKATGSRS